MHDMHNSLFGGLLGGSATGGESMDLSSPFTDSYIHKSTKSTDSNLHWLEFTKMVQQVTIQIQSSTRETSKNMSPSFTDALCHYIPYQFKR